MKKQPPLLRCRHAVFFILVNFAWIANAAERPVTVADARTLPTQDLAQRVLPDELARQVLSHSVNENLMFGRPDSVTFQLPAQSIAPDMCQRDHLHVGLAAEGPGQPILGAGTPVRGRKIALGNDCERIPPQRYAHVQPREVDVESAVEVLRWLAESQNIALDEGRLTSSVSCRSDIPGDDPCIPGNLELLRGLALDRTFIIEPKRFGPDSVGWRLAIMPSGPGKKFWDTSVIPDPVTGYRIALEWTIPAPF